MRTSIFIRADSSTRIGSGHVMRCLTLAEELRDDGATVSFISRTHSGNLNELIRKKGFQCHELPEAYALGATVNKLHDSRSEYAAWLGVSQQSDAEETIEAFCGINPDWLIVDHYGLDEEWERALRPYVSKIMVIDDLANRRHDCDLLLDQNYFANGEKRYDDLVPSSCAKLLGPKYALLRKEFRQAKKNLRERSGEVKRVLVFFGGSDPENYTGLAIEALSDPELNHLQVNVVIGAQNPNREKIENLIQGRPGTTLHIQTTNMAELMNAADLAIGAGGGTTWERLAFGLPSIVIPIAANQEISTTALSIREAIAKCEKEEMVFSGRQSSLKETIVRLIENPEKLVKMSLKGREMVALDGAKHVASLLVRGLNGGELTFRRADMTDCSLYWYWANDHEVRQNAFQSESISWEKHQLWFASRMADPGSVLLVFESRHGPVGQVRLEGDANQKVISYSISRQYRGNGLGTKMIAEVIASLPPFSRSFLAEVKKDNKASVCIFEKLGFQKKKLLEKDAFSFTFGA